MFEVDYEEHYDKWAWCNNNCFLSPENQIYRPSLKKTMHPSLSRCITCINKKQSIIHLQQLKRETRNYQQIHIQQTKQWGNGFAVCSHSHYPSKLHQRSDY